MAALAPPGQLPSGPGAPPREVGIDAIRALLSGLVVFHHAAITYGAPGGWFYREVAPSTSPVGILLTMFVALNQAFFMGLFFLLSGYFTPRAIEHHGLRAFLRERLIRLGLPILAFGLVLGPVTVALAATARGRSFWESLAGMWSRGSFVIGPLWFAEALLIFSALLVLAALLLRRPLSSASWPFPGPLTLAVLAFLIGLLAFLLRLLWPVGTEVYGLQLGYFASYIVLYAAGLAGARARWWSSVPARSARSWLAVSAFVFWILPLALLLDPGAGSRSQGGVNAAAVIYAFWEPFVAWGIILGLLWLASRYRGEHAPVWAVLGRRSYGVFVIHPPVLVAVSLAWRDVAAPALLKALVTGSVALAICVLVVGWVLRIPGLRRVL